MRVLLTEKEEYVNNKLYFQRTCPLFGLTLSPPGSAACDRKIRWNLATKFTVKSTANLQNSCFGRWFVIAWFTITWDHCFVLSFGLNADGSFHDLQVSLQGSHFVLELQSLFCISQEMALVRNLRRKNQKSKDVELTWKEIISKICRPWWII